MDILEFENLMKEPAAVTEERKKTKAVEEKLKKAEADKAELLDWLKTIKEDAQFVFKWSTTIDLKPMI